MADFQIRSGGTSRVPLGGRAVIDILVRELGEPEDVTSVRVLWKSNTGATLSDQTYTSSDISTTATDGGAISITNPSGTGTYRATYSPPNNGTYTPTSSGLQFSVQVIAVDEDGTADSGAIAWLLLPADVTITLDTTTVAAVVKRRTGILSDTLVTGPMVRDSTRKIVDLGAGPIYAIDAAFKNGAAIVSPTNFTWNTYGSRATLVVAAVDTDEFLFRVQRRLSDTALQDYIDESTDILTSTLRPFYDDASLQVRPTFEALVTMRTVGKVKIELVKGSRDNADYAEGVALVREAEAIAKAIARGERSLLDESDEAIARAEDSLAAGFRHADGVVNGRLDIVNRAQVWAGVLSDYWPEIPPLDLTSPRVLS